MSIRVVKEPESAGPPYERCCFCWRPTQWWHAKKDVAVCPECASTHATPDIPKKQDWCKQTAGLDQMTTPQTTPTRDEGLLRALIEELRPYAAKPLGSIRIDTDDIRKIVDWFDASPAAAPVSEAEPVAFPADGELLNMEDGERANAFWRWSKAAGLPLHMAESGLNRFHADDRTEWAWQAWCAALAKPASSPAGGEVREAQIEAGAKAIRQARVNGITPPEEGTAYDRKLAEACLRAALSQSTSPAESPTASGETVGSFRDRGPVATNPPGRGGPSQDSTSGEVGE